MVPWHAISNVWVHKIHEIWSKALEVGWERGVCAVERWRYDVSDGQKVDEREIVNP